MSLQRYIGGFFAEDDSVEFLTNKVASNQIPWDEKNCIGFETGSDAIAWFVKNERDKDDVCVYFPIHYCEDTIERVVIKIPQIQVCRYKDIHDIKHNNCIVIWLHFNGHCPISEEFLEKDFIILEDCVQSIYSLQNRKGKASFTSLRKWLELDLALLIGDFTKTNHTAESSSYLALSKQSRHMKREWLNGAQLDENLIMKTHLSAEHSSRSNVIYFQDITLAHKYDWHKILVRRKENATILLNLLANFQVKTLENSELFVMIELKNRNYVREKLRLSQIFAPVHWINSLDAHKSKSILSLPIDQRYSTSDMNRIADTLKRWI